MRSWIEVIIGKEYKIFLDNIFWYEDHGTTPRTTMVVHLWRGARKKIPRKKALIIIVWEKVQYHDTHDEMTMNIGL